MSASLTPLHPHATMAPAMVEDRAHSVIDLLPTYIDLAGRIANTEFVPKDLRRRPEAVLAALLSGAERGLGPMESLRLINIIEGRPNLAAEGMRALVLAAGHEIEIVESTPAKATVVGRRAGSDSTSPPFTWTLDRARRARLANKDNWTKYPEAMLLARASTDLCRAVFPDVIAGLASTEELWDEIPAGSSGRRAPTRKASPPAPSLAAPAGPVAPAVSPSLVSGTTEEPDPAGDSVSDDLGTPTWGADAPEVPSTEHSEGLARRLHAQIAAAFPESDNEERDRFRHALVAIVTRRRDDGPVTSSADLDLPEQLQLSEMLERVKGGGATVVAMPDATVEVRARGGWRYTVTLDGPLRVTVRQGDEAPAADDGPEFDVDPEEEQS